MIQLWQKNIFSFIKINEIYTFVKISNVKNYLSALSALLIALIVISCSKKSSETPVPELTFSNVLILGNSITYTASNPDVGWLGNWGMAASKAEFDFVHLLTKNFKEKNPSCTVTSKYIGTFEMNYSTYDLDTELKMYRDQKPDLVILRIGENVKQPVVDSAALEKRYVELINYFKSNNPNVRFFAAGSFWGNPVVDRIMARHSDFVSLGHLVKDPTNAAWGLFDNQGVASHPSDKGMKAIADLMWPGILKLK